MKRTMQKEKEEMGMKSYLWKNKGLFLLTLLLGTLFSVGSTMVALILQQVIDVSVAGEIDRFFTIVWQTGVYLAGLGLCYGLYAACSKKLVCRVARLLRGDVFAGVFQKSISDFKSVNSADYLSALTNDIKNVEDNFLVPLLSALQHAAVFITSFVLMLYLSPLVLLCLFVSMLLVIVIPGLWKGVIQKRQEGFSKEQSRLTVVVKDFLSGFEVIHSYKMKEYVIKAFGESNATVYHAKYALDKITATVEALSTTLGVVVQCVVLFVSAYLIITGQITAGVLVGLVQVAGTIVMPIQTLSQSIPKMQGCKPILERLSGLTHPRDTMFTGRAVPSLQKGITVKNLRFGYTEEQEILRGVEFTFQKGKKYAVVGKSGCGKTTLINLLTGYYAGFQGEILYDEGELRTLDVEKVGELSSVIHQNVYMFDESIGDNICLHRQVESSKLQQALDMSGVTMFLQEDKSLDTPVGENGSSLSGGQRQRIAVARALVQEKALLILDEGTSAVDQQTAYDIENQLLQVEDLTLVTITHTLNPSLLSAYDVIVFMENGKISEAGPFEALLSTKAGFADFYSLKQ